MSERDDELVRHFGTLWRTAMVGLDTLREVAVRSTQAGRLRVDIALLQREKAQLLETLGEMIVGMIDDGSFEDIPESVKQAHSRIKDVEQRLRSDESRAHDNAFGAPRGYEPEAATDYGDDSHYPKASAGASRHDPLGDEIDDDLDEGGPRPANGAADTTSTNGSTRRSDHR